MIKKWQKEHTKTTLSHWNKEELIDYIIMLEHNINVVQESFENQYNNCLKLLDDMSLVNKTYFEAKQIIKKTVHKGGAE